jgi:hypothetical protein
VGWAAAFLIAVAMYFQVSSARTTDRRLALAGLDRVRLATARLVAGVVLALLAAPPPVMTSAGRAQNLENRERRVLDGSSGDAHDRTQCRA